MLSFLIITAGGCSGKSALENKETSEKGNSGKVNVKTNEGKVEVETEKGKVEVETGDVEYPEGFPEDFPIYKNGKLTAVIESSYEGKKGYMLNLETSDQLDDVFSWYESELPKAGYEVVLKMKQSGVAQLNFQKSSKKVSGAISFYAEGDKTLLNLLIAFE